MEEENLSRNGTTPENIADNNNLENVDNIHISAALDEEEDKSLLLQTDTISTNENISTPKDSDQSIVKSKLTEEERYHLQISILLLSTFYMTIVYGILRSVAIAELVENLVSNNNSNDHSINSESTILYSRMNSVRSCLEFLVQSFYGHFADRYGRRIILFINFTGLMISTLFLFFATQQQNINYVWISIVISGFSDSIISSVVQILTELNTMKKLPLALGVMGFGLGFGNVIGPLIYTGLTSIISKQDTFLALIAVWLCMITAIPFLQESNPKVNNNSNSNNSNSSLFSRTWKELFYSSPFYGLYILFQYPMLRLLSLLLLIFSVGMESFYTVFFFFMDSNHYSTQSISILYSCFGSTLALAQITLPYYLLRYFKDTQIIFVGFLFLFLSQFLLLFINSATGIQQFLSYFSVLCLGLGSGVIYPLLFGSVPEYLKGIQWEIGLLNGALRTIAIAGEVIGQTISGNVYAKTQNSTYLGITSGLYVIAILTGILLHKQRQKKISTIIVSTGAEEEAKNK